MSLSEADAYEHKMSILALWRYEPILAAKPSPYREATNTTGSGFNSKPASSNTCCAFALSIVTSKDNRLLLVVVSVQPPFNFDSRPTRRPFLLGENARRTTRELFIMRL